MKKISNKYMLKLIPTPEYWFPHQKQPAGLETKTGRRNYNLPKRTRTRDQHSPKVRRDLSVRVNNRNTFFSRVAVLTVASEMKISTGNDNSAPVKVHRISPASSTQSGLLGI